MNEDSFGKNAFFSRSLDPGMGMAVAKRTYLREGESWADVAMRVAAGNCSLVPTSDAERLEVTKAIAKASFLPAGRHLQHGDNTQKDRNIEVFSNCSTSCSSFLKFYLLLNGSGVGRSYNNEFMLVDYKNMPDIILQLDPTHPDFNDFIRQVYGSRVRHYMSRGGMYLNLPQEVIIHIGTELYLEDLKNINMFDDNTVIYEVEDSREGWAKGLEYIEVMAYEKKNTHQLILDLSKVRDSTKTIGGMQGRKASGPAPLAYAYWKISKIKNNVFSYYDDALKIEIERVIPEMMNWMQTILVDHYASECVANGGARRSARISTKYWQDEGIFDFINLKNDFINSENSSILWSSNNSVMVDKEFWENCQVPDTLAKKVFDEITNSA